MAIPTKATLTMAIPTKATLTMAIPTKATLTTDQHALLPSPTAHAEPSLLTHLLTDRRPDPAHQMGDALVPHGEGGGAASTLSPAALFGGGVPLSPQVGAARCLLPAACCPLPAVRCPLPAARCPSRP